MKNLKRTLAFILALFIVALNLPSISFAAESYFTTTPSGYKSADEVVYHISNGYVANWGARGEIATFETEYAEKFYTGSYTYETLSSYAGGTSQSNAPSSSMYSVLKNLMSSKQTYTTSYDDNKTLMRYTDCLLSDINYISSFYSGKQMSYKWAPSTNWNREHTWPNSKGDASGKGENDIMMLRPTSISENSSRGNTAYGESSGYYDPNEYGANLHGDCARIMLYVYCRWGNTGSMWGKSGVMESLDVLLKWIEEDPVDTWELARNDSVQSITGTRNVFVDYPELAFLLFGEDIPEDMPTPSSSGGSSSCQHIYTSSIVAPTCTEAGYTLYTCSLCGRNYKETYAVATGHNYSKTASSEATCLNSGSETYTCSACGNSYTNSIKALGHNYIITETIDPTETTQGYNVYTCRRCGDSYNAVAGSVVGEVVFKFGEDGSAAHSDGSAISSGKEYTSGDYTLTLNSVSKIYGGACDAKGNSALKVGTSSATGSFEFTVPDNVSKVIIMAAQYKANVSKLSVNGETHILSAASNNGEYEAIEVDTSTSKTVKVSTATGGLRAMINSISYTSGCAHFYENNCDATCNLCGFVRTVSHSYIISSADATCTESGSATYTCSACGDSYSETVSALGHDFLKGEVIKPTYTEKGYTVYTCSRCDESENRDYTDVLTPPSEDGNEIVFEFGENGSASHYDGSALNAGETFTSGDYTLTIDSASKAYKGARDAKGNSAIKVGASSTVGTIEFTVPENIVKVIIKVAGYKAKTVKITVNRTAYTISTVSDNGKYTEIEVDTSSVKTVSFATTSTGYRAMIDSVTYIPASQAHTHDYKALTIEPACTENGKIVYTCSCGHSYAEIILATGHMEEAIETYPTCTEKGYITYLCGVCGNSYVDDWSEPLGHEYVPLSSEPATCGKDGFRKEICDVCSDVTTEIIASTGQHVFDHDYDADCNNGCGYIREVAAADNIINVKATATDLSLTVTWVPIEGITTYTVYVKDSTGATIYTKGLDASATSFKVAWPEINYDETYKIGIRAKTTKWLSTVYVESSLVIGERVVDVKAESSKVLGRRLKVSWKAYEGADRYLVYVFRRGDAQTTANIVTSAVVNGGTTTETYITNVISPEVDYTVCVRARVNGSYTGLATAIGVNARLGVYAPESFTVRGNTPNKVAISWDEVRGADKYWVQLTDDETGEQFIRQSLSSMASIPNLKPNTTYSVKLHARITDADGVVHYSGYSVVLGTVTTVGWEDINVIADENAKVTWKAHTDAAVYYVYRGENGVYKKIATITDGSTSYVDTKAKAGKTYTYAIKVNVVNDLISTNSGLMKGNTVTIA